MKKQRRRWRTNASSKQAKKKYRSTAVLFGISAVLLLLLWVWVVPDHSRRADYTYEELTAGNGLLERIETVSVGGSGWANRIYVQGEDKPYSIDVCLTSYALDRELAGLQSGAPLRFYYAKAADESCAGELAELKSDKTLFTLEEYRAVYRRETGIERVGFPVLIGMCIALAGMFLVLHLREQRK